MTELAYLLLTFSAFALLAACGVCLRRSVKRCAYWFSRISAGTLSLALAWVRGLVGRSPQYRSARRVGQAAQPLGKVIGCQEPKASWCRAIRADMMLAPRILGATLSPRLAHSAPTRLAMSGLAGSDFPIRLACEASRGISPSYRLCLFGPRNPASSVGFPTSQGQCAPNSSGIWAD